MDYIILVKEVPDTDTVVFDDRGLVNYGKSNLGGNKRDLRAIRAAVALRGDAEEKILALSFGFNTKSLQEAYGWGVDSGYLIENKDIEGWDSRNTASALTALIQKLLAEGELSEDYLIFAGSTGADFENGQTAIRVAQQLGIPQVTYCEDLSFEDGTIRAKRNTVGGYETVESPVPALITITETFNRVGDEELENYYPPLKMSMKAKKQDAQLFTRISLEELAVEVEERTFLTASDKPPENPPAQLFEEKDSNATVTALLDAMKADGRPMGG